MPEGPEVETVRRGLLPLINRKICLVKVSNHYRLDEHRSGLRKLLDRTIIDIQRRGKFLVFYTDGIALLNHLGMTGKWLWQDQPLAKVLKAQTHWKLGMTLDDDSSLVFIDARTFGRVIAMGPEDIESYPPISSLGPDILQQSFNITEFRKRLHGNKGQRSIEIGKALLNYSIVSGCGNIYKCESLWLAKINPFVSVAALSDAQIDTLGSALSTVGKNALDHKGTSFRDYTMPDGYSGLMQNELQVYGKEGEPCPRCLATIERVRQSDRSTFYCPKCQSS